MLCKKIFRVHKLTKCSIVEVVFVDDVKEKSKWHL